AFNNFTNSAFSTTTNATTLAVVVAATGGGGGCALDNKTTRKPFDPLLPMLLMLSLLWLCNQRSGQNRAIKVTG
ncbi:MAG: JDVT-CTERM domain-containing protein, partial [Mariprofundus sp.]|nr:JDVT-CTERM domain-containing protein [Mariprofundus sp.]